MSKTKSEKDIDDIDFIINELVRYGSMEVRDLMAYLREHKNDYWHSIPSPRGDGSHLTIGEAAGRRFYELAARHLATRADLNNNFDIDLFIKAVKNEFVWTFLKKREKELSQRTLDKMLSGAVRRAKKAHKALTHYIPCIIVSSSEPEAFRIGPVVFVRMEKFLQEHKDAFEAERERIREDHIRRCQEAIAGGRRAEDIATPDISEGIANRLVRDTIAYFEKFKWMAMVSIPECDVTLSRERAERAIEAALDILKLFFGRSHGEGLRQGHSIGAPPNTAKLTREVDGKFDFSLSWASQDTPTGSEWINVLIKPDDSYFRAAASALGSCVDPQYSSHLKERFLDAMAWYGQAISEQQTSVQIVKYVAALERLTVTKKLEEGLTSTVTRRAALLSYDGTKEGYERSLKDAEKVYDYRSGLMHGSRSPFDKDLKFVVPLAEKITQKALFNSLRIFTRLEHEVDKAKAKDLEAKYLQLEGQLPQDSAENQESVE
jgi:hypothetical protein